MLTHQSELFSKTICPSNFCTPYNPLNCISSWTWGPGGLKLGCAPYLGGPERQFRTVLCFTADVFLCFNLPQDIRAPSADRCETLLRDLYLPQLFQKFSGPPVKILRAKNVQNLDRFYTTSVFDHEYLRNDSRYPKS